MVVSETTYEIILTKKMLEPLSMAVSEITYEIILTKKM